ncbi:hypothetical protein OV203_22715 [Nannocystis sp. ILAH1]|uniref:hypothetical protein n=1 Tax=Nannocystis sp. ILAH1 TaxID=2996789 RepID=UPI00226E23C0|nr:hypothetical protein [Nannocystis sp. ILAH1]MCY0989969.1 hypothetical protein [Nannocystis sp. ILAH1]
MQVVLHGLGGVADAQTRSAKRRLEVGDLAAVHAALFERGAGLAGEAAAEGAQLAVVLDLEL